MVAETSRLYAAQADASPIVEICLASDRPSVEALLLAADCESEALQLRADLRERLRRITEEAIEDPEPERARLAAEYILDRRIRNMTRIDDDHYLDTSPVTHAEYQLFLDEMCNRYEFRQPDHWESYQFAPGAGRTPIVGIRVEDAWAFCEWLNERISGEWEYSLPMADIPAPDSASWRNLRFFTKGGPFDFETVPAEEILERVRKDYERIMKSSENVPGLSRSARRVSWFAYWFRSDVGHLDRGLAIALPFDFAHDLDRARARAVYLLNWLCIVENRIEGNEPPVESLWLARVRNDNKGKAQSATSGP